MNRVTAAEDGARDSRQARLADAAAVQGASGAETAANGSEQDRIKQFGVPGIERAVDKNGSGRISLPVGPAQAPSGFAAHLLCLR
jgi:hypothetical protein